MWKLRWFRSQKEEELEELKVEEQKLKNKILEKELKPVQIKESVEEAPSRPFSKVKFVDGLITVVLNDGDVVSKSNSTTADFERVRKAKNEQEVLNIIYSKEVLEDYIKQEGFEPQVTYNSAKMLEDTGEFEIVDNSVYLKGIKRSLPALLVNKFAEVLEVDDIEQYESLKKFWLKCCLNPNAQSAEDLYNFLRHHKFKIDRHGNFYAYRRVVSKGSGSKELVKFVANAYNKVKAIWKKKPIDYAVYKDDKGNYGFTSNVSTPGFQSKNNQIIGNLQDLYVDLPNLKENRYTSAHTGKEDYRVGQVESMPRFKGDDNNQVSCSKGYHAASKAYDYSNFGDTPILVIINPMDVLAVPKNEDGKLRTCRWFFAMTLDEDEQFILDEDDFDVSELGDIFEEKCSTNLENYVQNSIAEEVKRHTFSLPAITGGEIKDIVHILNDMKSVLSKRVVNG